MMAKVIMWPWVWLNNTNSLLGKLVEGKDLSIYPVFLERTIIHSSWWGKTFTFERVATNKCRFGGKSPFCNPKVSRWCSAAHLSLQDPGIHSHNCWHRWCLTAHVWVSLQTLLSMEASYQAQGLACSLGAACIQCILDKGVTKAWPFASIYNVSEGPSSSRAACSAGQGLCYKCIAVQPLFLPNLTSLSHSQILPSTVPDKQAHESVPQNLFPREPN